MHPTPRPLYDALILGGGPGGATAALVLARAGKKVVVLEKAAFPRFHIGESFLPRNMPLLRELGLEEKLCGLPHVPKYGAEFGMGHGNNSTRFSFDQGLLPGAVTFNIARAPFDAMLLNEARAVGAEVREGAAVKKVLRLADGDVAVQTDAGAFAGRCLIDASGQATIVGRHLGTREPFEERHLQKVAYFQHFDGVKRPPGREGGHPFIAMCDEAWFWMIPLDERRTSVGLVMDAKLGRETGVPATKMLRWGVARCPAVRERMGSATGPDANHVTSDFSYRCRPYAGPGYFLVGDAAAFLDPIFSTGACLAMMSGREAADHVLALLAGRTTPDAARRRYVEFIEGSTGVFFELIREFYDHSFRELFLHNFGPMKMHRAILSVLAGNVFPRPVFALRWRMWLFSLFIRLNRKVPLVPKRERFSLLAAAPREPHPAASVAAEPFATTA